MKRFMNKKVVAIGLAAGLALGAAVPPSRTSLVRVTGTARLRSASSTGWNVSVSSDSTNTLLPGSGSETRHLHG